ncbi:MULTISPECIES: FecCD family ABC transporter permease [unclassified Helicobacter]|uniref:FecCD family ABC transporter permease n=1 Tax=unclassified Helicobacter TaxID=2593540 RepID=UPI0009EF29A5|nr:MULTISPECIES: iron ABC transporter permease [unclassified Helicobacter]
MSLSHKRYLQYLPHALKIFGIAILCLIGVAFVAIIALSIGRYHIPIAEVCATLLGNGSEEQENIIFSFRLPRVILALVAGMGLSVSGCAFQSIFRNPLATPDILGVTSGASFGAVLALLLGLGTVFVGLFGLVFGLCALALVWGIAYDRNTPYSTITMILSGIIISALFQSLISLVKYVSDPQDTLPTITYWLLGSLESSFDMPYFAGVAGICAGSLVVYALSWKLNLLALSDDEARTLGVPLWRLRAVLIFACTLVVACGVSLCGIIGWVGLLVPHIARLLVGSETSKLVPLSAVLGAIFVCALDTISRSISSEQIPISILTALLGAPFFIYILWKNKGMRL